MFNFKTIILTLGWLLATAALAPAETLKVGVDGSAPFHTIQDAIDAAAAGDVIDVGAGTYRESLTIDKDDLRLIGAGAGRTVIESSDTALTYLGASGGTTSGFTFRYAGTLPRPAVLIVAATPTLLGNEITGATLAGVDARNGGGPVLINNRVHGNQGVGVLVRGQAAAALSENSIWNNGVDGKHAGVEVRGQAQAALGYNKLQGNGGSGVFVHQGAFARLEGNSIVGNGLHGVSLADAASAEIVSNSILWNAQAGIRLRAAARAVIASNTISHHLIGLYTDGQAQLPGRAHNLYVGNVQDALGGIGLTPEDAQLTTAALFHPRAAQLFKTLEEIGIQIGDETAWIENAQVVALIQAEIFNQAGLPAAAAASLLLALRLDPASPAAEEARARLNGSS